MKLIDGRLNSKFVERTLISHSIAVAPLFPGLQRFKQGRNFKQWTGNDSKAFMKVVNYLIVLLSILSLVRSL